MILEENNSIFCCSTRFRLWLSTQLQERKELQVEWLGFHWMYLRTGSRLLPPIWGGLWFCVLRHSVHAQLSATLPTGCSKPGFCLHLNITASSEKPLKVLQEYSVKAAVTSWEKAASGEWHWKIRKASEAEGRGKEVCQCFFLCVFWFFPRVTLQWMIASCVWMLLYWIRRETLNLLYFISGTFRSPSKTEEPERDLYA